MTVKFSVIIPLMNKGPYITRAIKSVQDQSCQDFEIIVIDGGSHDEGPRIVKEMDDPRIHFIVQTGKGVSSARNEAVQFAKCEFIAFLDADDEWMQKHLETIVRLIENFPGAGMFATAYKIQEKDGTTRWADYQGIPCAPWEGLIPDYFKSGTLGEYPVWTSVAVIPKKVFFEVGGFPEGYWFGEDADLFGKIALKYPVAFSWELGGIYHWDAAERACDKKYPRNEEEPFVKTAREVLKTGGISPELKNSLTEYIAKKEVFRAYCNIKDGNLKNARRILTRCPTRFFYSEKLKGLVITVIPLPLYLFFREMRRSLLKFIRKKIT